MTAVPDLSTSAPPMTVAAVQMVSGREVAANLAQAAEGLQAAARAGARLAVLPEYFCLMGHRDTDKLAIAEERGDGPIQNFLADQARTLGLWVVGGTLPLRVPGRADRVFNTTLVFDPQGEIAARYDKIHLFAFDNGGERFDEGATIEAGHEPVTFEAEGLRIGLSICYDLRFPELYRRLSQPEPCDLLLVPSAFTYTTGQAHWEVLLRARAIENQCYVLAAAQGGTHDSSRRTWGHSLIIDPWGQIAAVQPEGPGVVTADLNLSRRDRIRRQLPALRHRVLA